MRYITVIGKPGCLKCSKMKIILESRGLKTELKYIETIGKTEIDGIKIDITEETHFPLFIYNNVLYDDYKTLNRELNGYTRNEC